MVDEQAQTSTETTTETTSAPQEPGSSTSTTTEQTEQERIDLAADAVADGTTTETTTETEDTRTDEEKAADAARAELFGAPAEGEEYTVEGLPEGMEIDKEALDAVAPVARELGLSNKGLSKIAGVYAEKVLPGVQQRVTNAIEQDIIAQRKTWEDEAVTAVKANGAELKNAAGETLSFDGKDISVVRSTAAKALDRIAPQGFREWLQETGLSVHPMMVAFTYQAGKLLAEDTDMEHTETGKARSTTSTTKSGGMHPEKFYNRG